MKHENPELTASYPLSLLTIPDLLYISDWNLNVLLSAGCNAYHARLIWDPAVSVSGFYSLISQPRIALKSAENSFCVA
jgi:hypothetical protein